MATSVHEDNQISRDLDKQLSVQLAKGDVSLTLIAEKLEAIRSSCEAAILKDFNVAATLHIEDRLWNAHQRVNAYFRTALSQSQKQPDQMVAIRKIRADYVKFIKSCQRFYRGFVRHLSQAYGEIPTLQRVAQTLNRGVSDDLVATTSAASIDNKAIVHSCHRTLIQLGDLSRYRETEVGGEKRDWSAAIGFYDLAGSILPSSGQSHNQLAVLALADGNMFRAIYHLYRSLASEEPHPQSEGNLKKAFSKVSSSWEKGDLLHLNNGIKAKSVPDVFFGWYLRLLELCYQGKEEDRLELEDEVPSRLTSLLRQETSSMLYRVVIVNIASADASEKRFQSAAESNDRAESHLALLRLNLRCFTAMLEQLSTELDDLMMNNHAGQLVEANALVSQLSPNAASLLPLLRIYSSWLRKNVAMIANLTDEASTGLHRNFWSAYARSLSVMAEAFPADFLPNLPYMLEEDVDTIGFQPIHCGANQSIWYDGDKIRTPWHEIQAAERVISTEMVFRIRGFLVTGLELAFNQQTPFMFDQDQYCFHVNIEVDSSDAAQPTKNIEPLRPESSHAKNKSRQSSKERSHQADASFAPHNSHSLDIDAERMVDSLVDLESDTQQANDITSTNRPNNGHASSASLLPANSITFPLASAVHGRASEALANRSLPNQRAISISPTNQHIGRNGSNQTPRGEPAAASRPLHTMDWNIGFQQELSTPKQLNQFPRLRSISHFSPLGPPGLSRHTRNMSTESTHSCNSIWSPEEPWNGQLAGGRSVGTNGLTNLGNGSFGTLDEQVTDSGMGSSLLFGASTTPWNMSAKQSRNTSESPRMASIWDGPSSMKQILGRTLS